MENRRSYLLDQRSHGRKVAAVWPARFPAELLWAHGFCVSEVWDPPLDRDLSPAHLQPFTCSIVSGGFELLASGGTDVADVLVFPHTCDSIQNLATLAKDLLGERRPCLTFYMPKGDRGPRAATFLAQQLRDLSGQLEQTGATATDLSMREALALGCRRANLLRELYARRAEGPLACSNEAFYTAVRGCEFLWPEDAVSRLEALLGLDRHGSAGGVPLVFTGVLPLPKDLPSVLDGLGVRVVEDDFLGCGRRVCRNEVADGNDFYTTLALRLLALPPCPTQGAPVEARLAFLTELVERSAARGVVFLSLRACEPDLFERPSLVAGLKAKGLPVLILETETGATTPGGMLTRLEAFLEVVA